MGAHRVAYALAAGVEVTSLGRWQFVTHTCDNPPCVNPAHLVLGTPASNRAEMVARGRAGACRPHNPVRGSGQHKARLTEFAVAEMRDKYRDGVSIPRLAAEYGVSTSTAGAALRGDTWTHVPGPVEMRSPTHWRWGH
jgi:hypothetical protein